MRIRTCARRVLAPQILRRASPFSVPMIEFVGRVDLFYNSRTGVGPRGGVAVGMKSEEQARGLMQTEVAGAAPPPPRPAPPPPLEAEPAQHTSEPPTRADLTPTATTQSADAAEVLEEPGFDDPSR